MNDVSRLGGASPVSPTSSRVWKSPREQKPGDRPAGKRPKRYRKEEENRDNAGDREENGTVEIEEIETAGDRGEPSSYGSGVFKKSRNHKIDLII